MKIESIHDFETIETFLIKYEDSSLFLLANLFEYGPKMGDHINSGDYYGVYSKDFLICIFSITRRGNLLIQDGDSHLDAQLLYDFLIKESSVPITGCLGGDRLCLAVFELLIENGLKENYRSTEILYSFNLRVELKKSSSAMKVEIEKFNDWMQLQVLFTEEVGLESNLKESYYLDLFKLKNEGAGISGLFIGSELVSCAHLNAEYKSLCQVGGVFTKSKFRRKGFSKECMYLLMINSFNCGFEKMILFTGDENFAAQKLYESIGFKRVGFYGLYIGSYE